MREREGGKKHIERERDGGPEGEENLRIYFGERKDSEWEEIILG